VSSDRKRRATARLLSASTRVKFCFYKEIETIRYTFSGSRRSRARSPSPKHSLTLSLSLSLSHSSLPYSHFLLWPRRRKKRKPPLCIQMLECAYTNLASGNYATLRTLSTKKRKRQKSCRRDWMIGRSR
jgi:hypothetical protein